MIILGIQDYRGGVLYESVRIPYLVNPFPLLKEAVEVSQLQLIILTVIRGVCKFFFPSARDLMKGHVILSIFCSNDTFLVDIPLMWHVGCSPDLVQECFVDYYHLDYQSHQAVIFFFLGAPFLLLVGSLNGSHVTERGGYSGAYILVIWHDGPG